MVVLYLELKYQQFLYEIATPSWPLHFTFGVLPARAYGVKIA